MEKREDRSLQRLEGWCERNGAELRWEPLNWNRSRDDIVVGGKLQLIVTTSDGRLWRTGMIKTDDVSEMAARKDNAARAMLDVLLHEYELY